MRMQPAHSIDEIFKLGACMHAGLEGALDPPAQHAPERPREEVPVTVPL